MRYKHIFDLFDENGKWSGGFELVTDSIEIPQIGDKQYVYGIPTYTMYEGWCNETDNLICCGCCCPKNYSYDKETKKITYNGEYVKDMPKFTLETACQFKGVDLPEKYKIHKEKRENEFLEEYNKVRYDKEYFKQKYYRFKNAKI